MGRPRKIRAANQTVLGTLVARDNHGFHHRIKFDLSVLLFFNYDTTGFFYSDKAQKLCDWEDSGADDGFRHLYKECWTAQDACRFLEIPNTVLHRLRVSLWVVDKTTKEKRYAPIIVMRKLCRYAQLNDLSSVADLVASIMAERSAYQKTYRTKKKAQATTTASIPQPPTQPTLLTIKQQRGLITILRKLTKAPPSAVSPATSQKIITACQSLGVSLDDTPSPINIR
jgi:hypothetical protein